jgi:thiol-disulfide isomerase/thioredoxin
MNTITSKNLPETVKSNNYVLVVASAPFCKHCVNLEEKMPEISSRHPDVSIYKMDVTDKENEEWLKENALDSTPFVYVWTLGEFRGGDNFSSDTMEHLIGALKQLVEDEMAQKAQQALDNPEFSRVDNG